MIYENVLKDLIEIIRVIKSCSTQFVLLYIRQNGQFNKPCPHEDVRPDNDFCGELKVRVK